MAGMSGSLVPCPRLAALVAGALLVCALVLPARAAPGPFAVINSAVAIGRDMNKFSAWLSVMRRNAADPIFVEDRVLIAAKTWGALRAGAEGLTGMSLLRYVNRYWNQNPYVEDIFNWEKYDYWETPAEFVSRSGDCEDYAIAKYFTLRELGVDMESMRIFIVRDNIRRTQHAVLGVLMDGHVQVLDNISNAILPYEKLSQYQPEFCLNERAAWVFLKGRKKQKLNPAG